MKSVVSQMEMESMDYEEDDDEQNYVVRTDINTKAKGEYPTSSVVLNQMHYQ